MAQTFKVATYTRKQGAEFVLYLSRTERKVTTKSGETYKEMAIVENGKLVWVKE